MITGEVRASEGRIRLKVKGPRGRQHEIEAVIDTGFTESLSLPPTVVTALDLRWRRVSSATSGDGSQCLFDVYDARVMWDGRDRLIYVDEADSVPLIGMKLLKGSELKMQVRAGGKVTIKRLPRK